MEKNKNKNFVTNDNISPQLFGNKYLDALTRTHIAIPVTMFFVYAIGLIWYTKVATELSNATVAGVFFLGWLAFTYVEYQVHKRLYHMDHGHSSEKRKEMAYKLHGVHHDYPKDKQRLAMPPIMSLTIGTVLLLIFELVMNKFAFSFTAGFVTGYAAYLIVHYCVHIYRPPNNFLKALWTNHAIHHYQDDTIMLGVSSPLWDYIFGSLPKKGEKKTVEVEAK